MRNVDDRERPGVVEPRAVEEPRDVVPRVAARHDGPRHALPERGEVRCRAAADDGGKRAGRDGQPPGPLQEPAAVEALVWIAGRARSLESRHAIRRAIHRTAMYNGSMYRLPATNHPR